MLIMALPPNLDHDRLCEAALAILCLTAFIDHGVTRAWKGMDWDLLDALYQRGWIHDPKGKAKSVLITPLGTQLAEEFLERHFGRTGQANMD
jgi:hypothetical protein